MTGIESLFEVVRELGRFSFCYDLYVRLSDIADQIERERICDTDTIEKLRLELGERHDPSSDVSMSAYDLLPEEEREAIAWVREHGGLDKIKQRRADSIPRSAYERKKAGWLDHIRECETALTKRNDRIAELEDKLRDFQNSQKVDGSLSSYSDVSPAPKVLDADGVEIREGDTVYDVDTGEKMWVCALPEQGAYQCVKLRLANGMSTALDPCRLTHERPDSWERLEEDARNIRTAILDSDKLPFEVIDERALDLVRRARALAGGA